MQLPAEFCGRATITVNGQQWHFTEAALIALQASTPITRATLGFCAVNLSQVVREMDQSFEIEYFTVPLRGKRKAGNVWIDA